MSWDKMRSKNAKPRGILQGALQYPLTPLPRIIQRRIITQYTLLAEEGFYFLVSHCMDAWGWAIRRFGSAIANDAG